MATQTGLGREVALKLYGDRKRGGSWPEHPDVARLHAAGTTEHGSFTASQLAAGGSLAKRLAARDIAREDALALCEAAERTLAALDVAHGALSPGNVLIDASGRALLSDFGMPGVVPSAAADREALMAMRARCEELPSRAARRRRRGIPIAAAGLGVVIAGFAAALALTGDESSSVPPPLPGARLVGSSLTGPEPRTLGCDGLPPSGSTPGCTVVQLRRDGRSAAFASDGVVRRWAVRGARGDVTLQIVRPLPGGRYVVAAAAQPEVAGGTGAQVFPTDVPVRRGDLLAVELPPRAGIGMTPGARNAILEFVGVLRYVPRRPGAPTGTDLDAGIELRVDYIPGARPRPVPTLTGEAARVAPAGRRLASSEVEFSGGRARTVAVVVVRGRVAVDLLRGAERLTRVEVIGADPRGELDTLEAFSPTGVGAHVAWRNPDGREVKHNYRTRTDRLVPVD